LVVSELQWGAVVHAGRWLLTGLSAAAVAAGLVMGDLTASAMDPYYRAVDTGYRDRWLPADVVPTQPTPIAFTRLSSLGDWPDATPPPPDEHAFDELYPPPLDDYAPIEPVRVAFDPDPLPVVPAEPPIPATAPAVAVAPEPQADTATPQETDLPAQPTPSAS